MTAGQLGSSNKLRYYRSSISCWNLTIIVKAAAACCTHTSLHTRVYICISE